jgi:hypothetical protein
VAGKSKSSRKRPKKSSASNKPLAVPVAAKAAEVKPQQKIEVVQPSAKSPESKSGERKPSRHKKAAKKSKPVADKTVKESEAK